MGYQQQLNGILGSSGMEQSLLDAALQRVPSVMAALRAQADAGEVAMLTLPYAYDDLPEMERWARKIRDGYSHLVIMGTGGSSLGAQMLTSTRALRFVPSTANVHYADNTDPDSMQQLLGQLPLADTFFLAVSKSGSTVETLAQLMLVLQTLKTNMQPVAQQCLALTMPGERPLRKLAEAHDIPVLDHDPQVGGRFSILSNVGLLPAAYMGLDIRALRQGAAQVMDSCWTDPLNAAPSAGAALQYGGMQQGKSISVLMPYCDRLAYLGNWYQQLWAESLGKDGKGSTPVRARGAVDQHSQLQLYLDGPKDKLITLITLDQSGAGEQIDATLAQQAGMDYLAKHSLGDLITAQQQGTWQTLVNNGVPVRRIQLEDVSEQTLGALLQHFMMETALTAGLLEVDAFNQPAVEESKQLARAALAG